MIEKAATLEMEVYNADAELDPNAHEKMFNAASSHVLPKRPAVELEGFELQLPFFQITNQSSQSQTTSDAANTEPVLNISETAKEEDEDDSQQDNLNISPWGGMLAAGKARALPGPKAIPGPKASAVPKAKQTPLPKQAPLPKCENTSSSQNSRPTKSRRTADTTNDGPATIDFANDATKSKTKNNLDESDKVTLAEYERKLQDKRDFLLADATDTEQGIQELLKNSMKSLVGLSQEIQKKVKSIGRRRTSGQDDTLKVKLNELNEETVAVRLVCQQLLNFSGSEGSDQLVKHSESWTFHIAIWKRAFKLSMLGYLKYGDWNAMSETLRPKIIDKLGESVGGSFFQLLINEVFQKLLRSLRVEKVIWIDFQ